jgi:hypothetical protein
MGILTKVLHLVVAETTTTTASRVYVVVGKLFFFVK